MKRMIKKYYKIMIFYVMIFFILVMPLPYYIEAPGGLININDRVKINSNYKINGSFNMTYVTLMKSTPSNILLSLFKKEWNIIKKREIVSSNETVNETEFRDHFLLNEANDNALIVAYNKANKYYKIEKEELFVTYVYDKIDSDLKIKDQIISINGVDINKKEQIYEIINNSNIGDNLDIEVLNNGKYYQRSAKIINNNNQKILGIMVNYKRTIKTEPNIKFNFKKSESGSSGGLMMALTIYNNLIEEDLTNGKIIAGTGTIDSKGIVGEIDGVKYKIMGAVKKKADVFLVPNDNYKEALQVKNKYKYDIKLVKINTFDEAIEYLKTLN